MSTAHRFFSDQSYWNTPLPADAPVADRNDHFIELLRRSHAEVGFHLNTQQWTIPIYEVDEETPRVSISRRLPDHIGEGRFLYEHSKPTLTPDHPVGHAPGFGPTIPMPTAAEPDAMTDGHLTLIDRRAQQAWDLWGAAQREDGSWWCCSGITYALDGPGVFDPTEFAIRNGESIHLYGPCRAAGVPNIAGLVLYHEIQRGRIEHKLAFATRFAALLEHDAPATWTDGGIPGGIPEGITIQLDPALDLSPFSLSPAALIIARALQEYGAVLVDVALGSTLSVESVNGHADRTWDGTLSDRDLHNLPFEHFRFLDPGPTIQKGMIPSIHPIIFQTYHEYMNLHPEKTTTDGDTIVGWPKEWHTQLVEKFTAS